MGQWIGLGITVVGLVISGAVLWGRMTERVDNLRNSISRDIEKAFAQSKEHYEHEANEDAHWTKREREDLNKKLDEIHHEVRSLAERMYGDR